MAIPLLSGLAHTMDSLFLPKRRPNDFNCARVHRGEYVVGTNEFTRPVSHDFRILSGEATIVPGRAITVQYSLEESSTAVLETFFIFPTSPTVRLCVTGPRGKKIMYLFREEDRDKSRMFKQKVANDIIGFKDAEPAAVPAA